MADNPHELAELAAVAEGFCWACHQPMTPLTAAQREYVEYHPGIQRSPHRYTVKGWCKIHGAIGIYLMRRNDERSVFAADPENLPKEIR